MPLVRVTWRSWRCCTQIRECQTPFRNLSDVTLPRQTCRRSRRRKFSFFFRPVRKRRLFESTIRGRVIVIPTTRSVKTYRTIYILIPRHRTSPPLIARTFSRVVVAALGLCITLHASWHGCHRPSKKIRGGCSSPRSFSKESLRLIDISLQIFS